MLLEDCMHSGSLVLLEDDKARQGAHPTSHEARQGAHPTSHDKARMVGDR
ncbi:MAG: hypothetical protein ACPIOQ_48100 [Promethearchaeia archaeon]